MTHQLKQSTSRENSKIMALPVAPLVAAGAQLVGSAVNAVSTGRINKKTREFSREMFDKQNQRDIEFWNLQNDYNDPQQQRARLENAGLNPHLMYGNGASAGIASSPNTSSAPNWNPRAPEIDVSTPVSTYFDVQTKQAQVDNMKVQTTVLAQDAALKEAQTMGTIVNAAKTAQEKQQAAELFQYTLDGAKENVRATTAQTDVLLNRDEREKLQTSQNLQEGIERILTMRSQRSKIPLEKEQLRQTISDLMKNNELKQLDINLREKGINPNDPTWMRIIAQAIENMTHSKGSNPSTLDRAKIILKNIFTNPYKVK